MTNCDCLVLFPDQLFEKKFYQNKNIPVFLVKDELFFKQFLFHKQKIIFHLETINNYQEEIKNLIVIESLDEILKFLPNLKNLYLFEIRDNWLLKKVQKFSEKNKLEIKLWASPAFLLEKKDYFDLLPPEKETFRQEFFYRAIRKRFDILLTKDGLPIGGKWNFDSLNRKKWPTKKTPPADPENVYDSISQDTKTLIQKDYKNNYGSDNYFFYQTKRKKIKADFQQFLVDRFSEFGPYEDSILNGSVRLNHSMISMYLNTGLITPIEILEMVRDFYNQNNNALPSVEGFIRQIIGWREFMAGIYEIKGNSQRNGNFFNHKQKLPDFFWNGESGILPFDDSWKKLNKFSYVHHIERLMIFGNLMLLLEIEPDQVYEWFMTYFIDAYDWVMVPNVYGMSQFADGGIFATKPYISGSNYILKMSNYKSGDWALIWDGLYWSFIKKNRDFFQGNQRLSIMVKALDKMSKERFESINYSAEKFKEKILK